MYVVVYWFSKCVFSCLVKYRSQLRWLLICSFKMYGSILDFLLLLFFIEIPSFLGNFVHIYGNLWTQRWRKSQNFIHKPMVKLKWPIRPWYLFFEGIVLKILNGWTVALCSTCLQQSYTLFKSEVSIWDMFWVLAKVSFRICFWERYSGMWTCWCT